MKVWVWLLVAWAWVVSGPTGAVARPSLVEPELVRVPAAEFRGNPGWTLEGLLRVVGEDLFSYRRNFPEEGAYLRVFNSVREVRDGGIFYYPHEDYHLRPLGERGWQRVENRVGRIDPFPALVRVPPGKYVIRTRWSVAVVEAKKGWITEVRLPESR